jgi:hypothetical protein
MRRRVLSLATAVTLGVSGLAGALVIYSPAAARDDTPTVCAAVYKTIATGEDQFLADMQQVSNLANSGDLAGAESAVKTAGADLTTLASQLRQNAAKADDPNAKNAINQLAAELDSLGGTLNTGLTGVQNFDGSKLDSLAQSVSTLCGTPLPTPTRSFGVPSKAPSGNPSPTS